MSFDWDETDPFEPAESNFNVPRGGRERDVVSPRRAWHRAPREERLRFEALLLQCIEPPSNGIFETQGSKRSGKKEEQRLRLPLTQKIAFCPKRVYHGAINKVCARECVCVCAYKTQYCQLFARLASGCQPTASMCVYLSLLIEVERC